MTLDGAPQPCIESWRCGVSRPVVTQRAGVEFELVEDAHGFARALGAALLGGKIFPEVLRILGFAGQSWCLRLFDRRLIGLHGLVGLAGQEMSEHDGPQ